MFGLNLFVCVSSAWFVFLYCVCFCCVCCVIHFLVDVHVFVFCVLLFLCARVFVLVAVRCC